MIILFRAFAHGVVETCCRGTNADQIWRRHNSALSGVFSAS